MTEEVKAPSQEHMQQALRETLTKDLQARYHSFIEAIQRLPIPVQTYIDGVKQMDFGMLWIKEAIAFSPLVMPEPKKEAEVVEIKAEEIKTGT